MPVSVRIKGANGRPTGVRATGVQSNPNTGSVTGRIVATDPDNDAFTYRVPASTARGAVVVDGEGRFTYTPTEEARAAATRRFAPFWDRMDSFRVTVDDGHGGTPAAIIRVGLALSAVGVLVIIPLVPRVESGVALALPLVVLGAGLDTRAYRIARHGDMPVFEVDQQVNIDRKVAVVERALGAIPPSVRLVAVDFESDALIPTLQAHGYRAEHRTFFIWEGVTQYLSAEAVRTTLGQLSAAAPGSKLVFTYIRQDFVDGTELYGAESVYRRFRGRNPVWKSGLVPEAVAELLADHGWRLVEQAGPSYYRDTYIRPTGRSVAASPIEWTVLAER